MSAKYALDAASQMVEVLEHGGPSDLEPAALAAALRIGCRTLRVLVKDLQPGHALHADVERLSKLRRECGADIDRATENVQAFSDSFLFFEQRALIQAGVSRKLLRFLFEDIDGLRQAMREPQLSTSGLLLKTERLQVSVCEAEAEVRSRQDAVNRRTPLMDLVKGGAKAIAGVGVIGANGAADFVATFGLTPWMTAASGELGAALIGMGLEQVLTKESKKKR